MEDFTENTYLTIKAGDTLAAFFVGSGQPLYALTHGTSYEDMTPEQKELAKDVSQEMVENGNLKFYIGGMEPVEDVTSPDNPVYVWCPTPEKPHMYRPVDIEEARDNVGIVDFFMLV